MADLIIKSTRILLPNQVFDGFLVIEDGRISELVQHGDIGDNPPLLDVGDDIVMPGLIDSHVHVNEPGRSDWEGFETATRAAAAGGITTVIDMPLNSSPVTTTVAALEEKRQAAQGKLCINCGFHAGIVPGSHVHIPALAEAGVLGFKAFLCHSGIDEFPNVTAEDLDLAMPLIAETGLPLLVHAELPSNEADLSKQLVEAPSSYSAWLTSRPQQWEIDAIQLCIELAKKHDCPLHIVHLAAAEALPLIAAAKHQEIDLTIETCPHYIYFAAEEISDGDVRFKCAPPIREAANNAQLREALASGLINFVASDHSPAPPEVKQADSGNLLQAWGGIASLQFLLPATWHSMKSSGASVYHLSEWLSTTPAKRFGLGHRKGEIAPGYDADITIWDVTADFTVTEDMIHHRHKMTPYLGKTLSGVVKKTIVGWGNCHMMMGSFRISVLGNWCGEPTPSP